MRTTPVERADPPWRREVIWLYLPLGGLALLAALIWFWWLNDRPPFDATTPRPSEVPIARQQPVDSTPPSADELLTGEMPLPLWRAIDESSVLTHPPYAAEWSKESRVLVRIPRADLRSLAVGDRLTLPLPQLGATFHPVIQEIDDGPGLSRAMLGKIAHDDGRVRRYVVTAGPASLFAYIDTPVGSYELLGGKDFGWLLPTSSMMAGWDFSQPDYILPDEGGGAVP